MLNPVIVEAQMSIARAETQSSIIRKWIYGHMAGRRLRGTTPMWSPLYITLGA